MSYDNIPGVNVTIKDGGLVIPERGGSESMLILAPSLKPDAPSEPVRVRSSIDLEQYGFGSFYVDGVVNPIAAEWKAATDGGCRVIYLAAIKEVDLERAKELEEDAIAALVAKGASKEDAEARFKESLTGTTASSRKRREFVYFYELLLGTLLDFSVDHIVVKGFTLEDEVSNLAGEFFPEVESASNFPDIAGIKSYSNILTSGEIQFPLGVTEEVNDKIAINVDGSTLEFVLPPKKYDGVELTIEDLAQDIQDVIAAHVSKIGSRVFADAGKIAIHLDKPAELADANTLSELGLSKKTIFVKTPQGVISRGSFAKTLADYCETKTLMKQATVGYIGINGPSDTKVSSIRKHVEDVMKLDTDVSPYLQIVASQTGVVLPGTNSTYFTNGATHYAALVSGLSPESATTNKEVKGVNTIRYEYSLRQLSRLTAKKVVTFRVKDGTQLVVTDGITSAPKIHVGGKLRDSDFTRLSTLRITQLAIDVVREAVDPYIGEANEIPQYNSMNTAINSALERIREAGVIRGYDFTVTNVTAELDHALVLLSIIPAHELRRIDVEVNLSTGDDVLAALTE